MGGVARVLAGARNAAYKVLMDEGQHGGAAAGKQRIRRRKRKQAAPLTPAQWWRRHGTTVMLAVTAAWAGFAYLSLHAHSMAYDVAREGMTEADLLYASGPPVRKTAHRAGSRWFYREGDKVTVADFDRSGQLTDFVCTSVSRSPQTCHSAHGIEIGTKEREIWNLLGRPARERLDGAAKYAGYPDIGLTLRLEQGRVTAIAQRSARRSIELVPQALRALVP
jgi:hypothetical protein